MTLELGQIALQLAGCAAVLYASWRLLRRLQHWQSLRQRQQFLDKRLKKCGNSDCQR
jgi:hypothetical protein